MTARGPASAFGSGPPRRSHQDVRVALLVTSALAVLVLLTGPAGAGPAGQSCSLGSTCFWTLEDYAGDKASYPNPTPQRCYSISVPALSAKNDTARDVALYSNGSCDGSPIATLRAAGADPELSTAANSFFVLEPQPSA